MMHGQTNIKNTENGFVVQNIIKKDEILEFVQLQRVCVCVCVCVCVWWFFNRGETTHRAVHSVILAAREQLHSLDIVLIHRAKRHAINAAVVTERPRLENLAQV